MDDRYFKPPYDTVFYSGGFGGQLLYQGWFHEIPAVDQVYHIQGQARTVLTVLRDLDDDRVLVDVQP